MAVKWVVFSPSRCSYMGWAPAPRLGEWMLQPCCTMQEFSSRAEAEALADAVGDGEVRIESPQPVAVVAVNDPTYW